MTEGFWEFSSRVYRLDGVSDACLALQDRWGVDINVLLFCCWAGMNVGSVSDSTMSEILGHSTRWAENVVRPLRAVRRWMKSENGESELRDEVKRVELAAERVQQEALEAMVGTATVADTGRPSIERNLTMWLEMAGVTLDQTGRRDLDLVVQASCGVPR